MNRSPINNAPGDADLERPRESLLTDEEQQRLYPGDLGLEHVATQVPLSSLPWGVPPSAKSSE
jgi:hypothetical protein